MRNVIYTNKAAKPPATYSQAIKAAGLVFVSGTAPADPETGQIVGLRRYEPGVGAMVPDRSARSARG
jgi:enamine deaminase RidA (YjgF/YER057c/UK114 family)